MTQETTSFQSEIVTIHRREIKNAPYNPRKISDKAFKRLAGNIKKKKLMSTLTWNRTTGNLVGGHQRLAAIDLLEKDKNGDYYLMVSVVELSEKEEKEQNIFLNSTTVQGEFDLSALSDLLKDLDHIEAGLDQMDLDFLGIDIFKKNTTTKNEEQDKDFLKQSVKDAKQMAAKRVEERVGEGESYVTLSFSNYKAKVAFCKRFGININDTIIKGETFSHRIELIK